MDASDAVIPSSQPPPHRAQAREQLVADALAELSDMGEIPIVAEEDVQTLAAAHQRRIADKRLGMQEAQDVGARVAPPGASKTTAPPSVSSSASQREESLLPEGDILEDVEELDTSTALRVESGQPIRNARRRPANTDPTAGTAPSTASAPPALGPNGAPAGTPADAPNPDLAAQPQPGRLQRLKEWVTENAKWLKDEYMKTPVESTIGLVGILLILAMFGAFWGTSGWQMFELGKDVVGVAIAFIALPAVLAMGWGALAGWHG